MRDSPLYRPESEQYQRERWLGEISLVRPITLIPLGVSLVVAIVCTIIWASLVSFPNITVVRGRTIAESGLVQILASRDGVVGAVLVETGQFTEANRTIMTIGEDLRPFGGQSTSDVRTDLDRTYKQVEGTIASLEETKATRLSSLELELQSTVKRLDALQQQRPIVAMNESNSTELFEAYQDAFDRGAIARLDVLRQESVVLEFRRARLNLEASIESARIAIALIDDKRAQIEMEFSRELSAFVRQLDQISSEMRNLSLLSDQEIVAPRDGVVKILQVEAGQQVVRGQQIAWIEPDDPALQVVAYVDDQVHKSIALDQVLPIEFDAFPYQRYGTLLGRIVGISPIPISSHPVDNLSGVDEVSAYQINLTIPRVFEDVRGIEHKLNSGMLLSIRIPLDERRLIHWVFPSLPSG